MTWEDYEALMETLEILGDKKAVELLHRDKLTVGIFSVRDIQNKYHFLFGVDHIEQAVVTDSIPVNRIQFTL
jgi:hypothetical protein